MRISKIEIIDKNNYRITSNINYRLYDVLLTTTNFWGFTKKEKIKAQPSDFFYRNNEYDDNQYCAYYNENGNELCKENSRQINNFCMLNSRK